MKTLAFLVLLFVSNSLFAAEQSTPSTISLVTVGSDYARVKLADMKVVQDCSIQNFYILDFSNNKNREAYSAILSANASKATIYFLLDGCYKNMPNITHVYVR